MAVQAETTQPSDEIDGLIRSAHDQDVFFTGGFPQGLRDLKTALGIDTLEIRPTDSGVFFTGGTDEIALGVQTWRQARTVLKLGPKDGKNVPVATGLSLEDVKGFADKVVPTDVDLEAEPFLLPRVSLVKQEEGDKSVAEKPERLNLGDVNLLQDLDVIGAHAGSEILVSYADPYSDRNFNLWLNIEPQESGITDPNAEPTFSLSYLTFGAPTDSGVEDSLRATTELVS